MQKNFWAKFPMKSKAEHFDGLAVGDGPSDEVNAIDVSMTYGCFKQSSGSEPRLPCPSGAVYSGNFGDELDMEALSGRYADLIDALLDKFPAVKESWYSHSMGGGFKDTVGYNALITECHQLLVHIHGSGHPDVQRVIHAINGESLHHLQVIEGILIGLRANLQNGLLDKLARQISIDIKSDFLEAARQLLDENQKDPAAVMSCIVLEDTLKRLAKKHNVDHADGKEMSVVAQSLLSKGVIEKSTNQSVQSFRNLRNSALHAEWAQVSKESVALLLSFLPAFIEKHGL